MYLAQIHIIISTAISEEKRNICNAILLGKEAGDFQSVFYSWCLRQVLVTTRGTKMFVTKITPTKT